MCIDIPARHTYLLVLWARASECVCVRVHQPVSVTECVCVRAKVIIRACMCVYTYTYTRSSSLVCVSASECVRGFACGVCSHWQTTNETGLWTPVPNQTSSSRDEATTQKAAAATNPIPSQTNAGNAGSPKHTDSLAVWRLTYFSMSPVPLKMRAISDHLHGRQG